MVAKDLPNLLQQGMEVYKTLRDDMERAMGLKQYVESLAELDEIMNGITAYLDQEEKNIVQILYDAYTLIQSGMQKAIILVSVIKAQSDLLLAVLNEDTTTEQQKEKVYTAGVYFSAFAKAIEAKMLDTENELDTASNKYETRLTVDTITDTLERVHTRLANEMGEAIAEQRAAAYSAATLGILGGPIGLIISYSVAAGVTEGDTVKDIRKKFQEQRDKVSAMKEDADSLKKSVDERK